MDDLEHDLADPDEVELPLEHHPSLSSRAAATMQHITASGRPGATYLCCYLGSAFRAVVLEGYIVARRREIAAELGTALE